MPESQLLLQSINQNDKCILYYTNNEVFGGEVAYLGKSFPKYVKYM